MRGIHLNSKLRQTSVSESKAPTSLAISTNHLITALSDRMRLANAKWTARTSTKVNNTHWSISSVRVQLRNYVLWLNLDSLEALADQISSTVKWKLTDSTVWNANSVLITDWIPVRKTRDQSCNFVQIVPNAIAGKACALNPR